MVPSPCSCTPATAATLPVSNGGSLYLSETTTVASAPFGNISALSTPGNYTYLDSWTAPQSTVVSGTSSGFTTTCVYDRRGSGGFGQLIDHTREHARIAACRFAV